MWEMIGVVSSAYVEMFVLGEYLKGTGGICNILLEILLNSG
jgi:hypothetical protein